MSQRRVYRVIQIASGWIVRSEGKDDDGPFETRSAAIDRARQVAKANTPSQVNVKIGGDQSETETEFIFGSNP